MTPLIIPFADIEARARREQALRGTRPLRNPLDRLALINAVRSRVLSGHPGWLPGHPPLPTPVHITGPCPPWAVGIIAWALDGIVEHLSFGPADPAPLTAALRPLLERARQVRAIGTQLRDAFTEAVTALEPDPTADPATCTARALDRALLADWDAAWVAFYDALAAAAE